MAIGMPGPAELLLIFGILVLFFGASRIPSAAASLGTGIREFRRSLGPGGSPEPTDDP